MFGEGGWLSEMIDSSFLFALILGVPGGTTQYFPVLPGTTRYYAGVLSSVYLISGLLPLLPIGVDTHITHSKALGVFTL